jgi:N-methylhydantoinase B
VLREDVLDFILLNVKARDLVDGDVRCQIGSANLGERRLHAMLARYGVARLEAAIDAILDATERRVRSCIATIPSGVYRAERAIDHDGIDLDRSPTIRLRLEVRGDRVVFDYTDSDPQVAGYVNSTLPNTIAQTQLALFATHAIAKDIDFNEGAVRPLTVIAPLGSITHAREPAATSCCTVSTGEAIIECVWLALAEVIPDRVPALWARWCAPATAGVNPRNGRYFADIHFMSKGGGGAVRGHDGWDHVGTPVALGGLRAPDPELHELVTPYRVLEYELLEDSAGAGQWRGGFGVKYRWDVLGDDIPCANFGSGARDATAPLGLAGGEGAPKYRMYVDRAHGERETVDGNRIYRLQRGDRFSILSSGGGGYGDPKRRPVEHVLADVRDGLVSLEAARERYGVAVNASGSPLDWSVDAAQTARLRGGARA